MTGNIMDYLEWYGNFDFDVLKFNEVDNLILCELSYAKLDGIVPEEGDDDYISIREAALELDRSGTMENCCRLEQNAGKLLFAMAESKRYRKARLYNYVNKHDFENQEQFCALHIDLDDGTTFVSFGGTDDSLLGWKEDLNMAYEMPVPAQEEAIRYFEATLNDRNKPIRVGGHSKGGNLAIYASLLCNESITKRILKIYNNDGPGFLKPMLETKEYLEIADRIQTIVPETSIIGMLLEHWESYEVVKSNSKGLMQHDGMTWMVCTDKFVKLDELSKESMVIDKTVTAWIGGISDEERSSFIDTLYELLTKVGIKNMSDFEHYNFAKLNALTKEMFNLKGDTGKMMKKVIRAFLMEYGKNVMKGIKIPEPKLVLRPKEKM